MDRQQIGTKLAVDGLGLKFEIDTFEDRLILQKAVYLAQAAGVDLGYYYHWYLHGPYCSSLTKDEYAIAKELAQGLDESENWQLDEKSSAHLAKIRTLTALDDREELRQKLELLASVHFLIDQSQVSGKDVGKIWQTLQRYDKSFSEDEIGEALKELEYYELIGG